MKFPCEMIVWKVLPAIRAKLTRELSKKDLSQKEIAKILDITEAAVSQYLSKKRAYAFKISKDLEPEFKKLVERIAKEKSPITVMSESCKLCKDIRQGGYLCQIHYKDKNVPRTCDICMEGLK